MVTRGSGSRADGEVGVDRAVTRPVTERQAGESGDDTWQRQVVMRRAGLRTHQIAPRGRQAVTRYAKLLDG